MNTLTNSGSFDFLVGKELIQVSVGVFQVILRFTDELIISIENTYYSDIGQGLIESRGDNIHDSKKLIDFLGQSISSQQTTGYQQVLITFSNQYSLKLLPNDSGQESYSVVYGNIEIFG